MLAVVCYLVLMSDGMGVSRSAKSFRNETFVKMIKLRGRTNCDLPSWYRRYRIERL